MENNNKTKKQEFLDDLNMIASNPRMNEVYRVHDKWSEEIVDVTGVDDTQRDFLLEVKKERVPVFLIFKEGDSWKTESSPEFDDWKVLGFLVAATEDLRQKLVEEFSPRDDEDDML